MTTIGSHNTEMLTEEIESVLANYPGQLQVVNFVLSSSGDNTTPEKIINTIYRNIFNHKQEFD